jgi:hypothetical protein
MHFDPRSEFEVKVPRELAENRVTAVNPLLAPFLPPQGRFRRRTSCFSSPTNMADVICAPRSGRRNSSCWRELTPGTEESLIYYRFANSLQFC